MSLASQLARLYPDRAPGTAGSTGAARWIADQLTSLGLRPQTDTFEATIPGRGRVSLRNVAAAVPGQTEQTIVVMAHRDDTGTGPGANDNASGTAAMIMVAGMYGRPPGGGVRAVTPHHTFLFLSTDGGAFGALGAHRFILHSPYSPRVVAVVNLDTLASRGLPRLEIGGEDSRSPAAALVDTAAARIADITGVSPGRTSAVGQLIDLAFPFSLYEQAPFVGHGVPAVTLTTAGDRPPPAFGDSVERMDGARFGQTGRAAEALVTSLDDGLALTQTSSSYLYLGQRGFVRGWAIEITLVFALFPFLAGAVDLFARCRRWHVSLTPALKSYRSRLGFWLWAGILFELFAVFGVWTGGAARPINPETSAAGNWPRLGLLALLVLLGLSWLVGRHRLIPRRAISIEEELAGYAVTLLVLGILALVVVAVNTYALIFLLPSLHAWLWLPQARERRVATRIALLLAGFVGPLFLLGSIGVRFGLGLDAPWYLAELTAVGYVSIVALLFVLVWLACAAQLAALSVHRYAPYPSALEQPPRGPIRNAVRATVLAVRARRRAPAEDSEAVQS
jgi:Peptidase family M28